MLVAFINTSDSVVQRIVFPKMMPTVEEVTREARGWKKIVLTVLVLCTAFSSVKNSETDKTLYLGFYLLFHLNRLTIVAGFTNSLCCGVGSFATWNSRNFMLYVRWGSSVRIGWKELGAGILASARQVHANGAKDQMPCSDFFGSETAAVRSKNRNEKQLFCVCHYPDFLACRIPPRCIILSGSFQIDLDWALCKHNYLSCFLNSLVDPNLLHWAAALPWEWRQGMKGSPGHVSCLREL